MKTSTIYKKSKKLPADFTVLKKGSSNKKLGYTVTSKKWRGKKIYSLTLVERETCPTSCHHWDDCYGNNMPFAHRFTTEGLTDKIEDELQTLIKKHPKGIVVRLHVLGDFYSYEYIAFWNMMLLKYPTLSIFGYTALDEGTQEADYIMRLNELFSDRCLVRFSRSKEHNEQPHAYYAAEESFSGKHFDCPEQSGKLPSCASCGLCWMSPRTVRFLTH